MITDPEPITRRLAITLVVAALRGDAGTVRALLYAADPDGFAVLVHSTLTLARALAVQLRSPQGLMAADVWLAECARGHPCRDTRLGAALILAHAMTCYPPVETAVVAETFGEMFTIGAATYNEVCCEADERFTEVLTAAGVLWHQLLPEAGTASGPCMVGNTAITLWPAPPKLEGTVGTVKHRTKADPAPPRPKLPIPPEAQVAGGPPARPYFAPGVPVSLRGLAIRLARERGVDSIYG
jgi:hypothetical protein